MADNKKKNKIPDYQKGIYSPRNARETYEAYQKGQTIYKRNSNGTTQFYQKDQKPVYTSIDSPIRKTNYDFLGTQENSIIKKLTIPTQKLNYSYSPESVDDVAQMTAWLRLYGNGDSDYEDLAAAVQNAGSKFYNPYWKGRSTQSAAQEFFRQNFGYEGAFDDKFFEDYLYLQQYTPRSDATGKLIQPGKKSTLLQQAGYWFTCLDMDRDTQHEVNGEWADLRKNAGSGFADFKTMYGREPSYDEFIDLLNLSSYNQLSKIDASRNIGGYDSSAVVQLNTGTNYSHEALAGMYYVLCNGGDVSEDRDYFEDAVSYYLEGASEKAAVEDASASVLSQYGYDVNNITDENYAQALSKAAKIGDMEAYAAIERYHWAQNAAPNVDTTDYFGARFGYYHDDAWFDAAGAIYEPIVKSMSLQDGSVQAPSKKDAPIYHAAYQYYLIKKNRGVTDELEAEYKAFTNDVQQYAEECKKYGNSYENYEYHIWNERLNKENYPNLVKYLADDLDTCRPVLIDKAGIENLIKSSYDSTQGTEDTPETVDDASNADVQQPEGNSVGFLTSPTYITPPMTDVAFSSEGASKQGAATTPEATPSPFPLGHETSSAGDSANTPQPVTLSEDYLNDQVQASAYEHTKRVDDARNKVESALALARSGATVNINQFAESGVPLTGIIDDDDANNLIVAMWKELQKDYYEDTLGEKYTDAQIESIDPVYKALVDGTGCTGDAKITPKALEDLYIQECISKTSSSALLGGIATYFLGSEAMDDLIDKINSDNEKALISAYAFSQGTAVDVVAYKRTFDNLIDKGYTEQAARETAYYEALFGGFMPTKAIAAAEAELSDAANTVAENIQNEEAYADNQVLAGSVATQLINEGLIDATEESVQFAKELNEDLIMGLSGLASGSFNAATKALINDLRTGAITPQDVTDGFTAAQEERNQRLMAAAADESAETQNSPNGAAAETPEEKPKGNVLQSFLDSINAYVSGSKSQEDHSEMFAAIGYDYGGLSIDNRCYEEQGRSKFVDTWNNRIADFVDDTEILTGIEAAAQKYGHGKNYGTGRDNDAGARMAPALEEIANSDLVANLRAAVGGMGFDDANERYLVKSAIRTNGIYFTYDEMNALYQAWNRGYITYDGFKEVLNNRKSSVTPQTANAAFHASMLEDSNVQRNERIASMRGMLTDTKIGRLDSDTALLVNEFMTAYDNLIQSGSDAASIAYTLSNGKYAPLLDLIGMKPEDIDADNYTDAILKLKEIKSAPATDTYILSNGVDGGYYTAEQIDAIDKLSECVASSGAQGYDFIRYYTPETLSEATGGAIDLKAVGLNGSLSDYMDDVFGEEWQYPYSNTGMDAVSVINNGLLSGYQSVLFAIPKALNFGANAIGKATGLGEDTSRLGNAYKEFEAANKEQSSTRMTSGENVASTLISMLPKYVLNSAIGTGLANAAESAFYGAETTEGITRIADSAMSANGMQRLVSDLVVGTKESAVGSGTSLVAADSSQKLDVVVGAYQSYVNNGYVLDAVKLARRIPYALQEFNYTTDRDLQKGQDIVTSITRGLLNASLELLMPNPLADKPAYSSGDAVSFINATNPIAVNNRHDAWRAVEAATRSNVLGVPAKTLTGVTQLCDSIFKELRVEMLKDAGEVILDATRDTQFKSEDGFGAYFSSLASNIIGNVGKYGEEYVSKYLSMAASISLINAVQMGVAKLDDFLSNDPVGRIKKLFVDYPDECDYHDPFANARVETARKEAYEEAYSKRPESAEDINVKSPDAGSTEVLNDSASTAASEPVKTASADNAEADTGWKRKPFDYSIFEPQKSDEATGSKYNYPNLERNRRGADPLAEIVEEAMTSDTPSEDLDAELLLTLARLGVTTEALGDLAKTQPEVLTRVGDALLAQVGSGAPVLQPKTFGEDGTMPRNGMISAQNYAAMAEDGKRDIIIEQAIDTAKKNYLEQDASLKAIGEAKQKAAREAEEKRQAVIEVGDQITQQTMSLEGVLRAAAAMNVDFNSPSVRDPMTGLQQSIAALESKQADAQKAADKAIQAVEDADAKYNDAVQRAEAQFDANVRPGMKDDLEARYDAAQAYIVQRKAQESIAVSEDNPRASGEPVQWESEDGQTQENKYDKRPEYTPELETPASKEANLMQELDTRVNSLTTAVKKALKAGESTAATMMTPVKNKTYNALIGIVKRIPAARDLIPMLFKTGYDDGTQQFSDARGDSKYRTTDYARDNFSGNFDVLYNKFGMIPYAESDDYIVLQNPAASKNGYIYSEHGRKAQGSAAFDDYSAGDGDGKARYYSDPNYLDAKKDYQEASAERAKLQKEAQAKRVALQQGGISPEEKLQLKQDIADADAKIAAWNDRIAIAAGEMQEIKNREDGILKQPYIVIRKSDYAILEGASELESAAASAQAKTADNVYLHAVTDYSRDQLIDMIVEATGVSGDVEAKLRANLADKRLFPTETDLATELLQTYADADAEAISQGKASSVPYLGFQKEADLEQFVAENGGWRSSGGNFDKLQPQKTFRVNTVLLHLLGMYKSYASGVAADSYSNPADAALAKDIAGLNVGSEEEFFGAIFDMYNKYAEPDRSQTGTNFETDGTGSNFAPSDPFARNPKGESKTTYYAPTDTDGKKTLYVNPNRRNYDLNGARKGEAPVYTLSKAENLVRKLYHGIATGNNPDARIIVYENGGFGGDAGRTTPLIVGAEYKNPETGEMERYLPPVEDILNGKSKYEVTYRLPVKDSDGKQKYTAADFIVTNTDWNGDFSDIDYSRQAMMETANALRENPNASPDELADHIRTYLIQREGDLRKQIHEILRSARYSKDKEGVIAAAENVKALTAKRDGIRAVLDSSDEELVAFAQKHGILPEVQAQDVDETSVMLPNPAGDGMIEASNMDEFAFKAAEAALSSENPNVVQAMKYSRYVQSDEVSAAIQKAIWKAIDKIATKDMNPLQRANYYSLRADSALAKAPNSGLYQDYQTEVAKAMEEAGIVPTSLSGNTPAMASSGTGTAKGEPPVTDTPKPVESPSTAIDTTASENPTKEATEPTEPETPARIAIDTTESEDEKSALEEFADLKREADDFPAKVEEEVSSGAKPKYEPMKPDENTRLSDDPNAEYSVPFAKSVLRYQEQRLKDLQEQINSMAASNEKTKLIKERNDLKQTLIHNRTVHFSREEVANALEGRAEYDPYKPVSTSGGKLTPRNAFKKLGKLLGNFTFGDRTTFSTKQLADAFSELFDPQYIQNHKEASTHVYEAYARQRSENLRYQYELALIENALNGDTEASRKILAEKEAEYVNAHVNTVKLRGGAPSDYERFRFEKMRVRAEAQETIDTMKAEWNPDASKDDLNARHHTLTDTTYGLIATTQKKMDALKRSYNALNAFGNKDMKSILSGSFGGRLPVPIVNVMLGAVVDATNGSAKNLQKFMADTQESMRIIGIPENDLAPMMNDVLNAVPFDESFARIYGDYDSEDGTAVAARGMYGEGYRIAQNAYKKYIDKYGNPKGGITSLFDTMERWVDATFGANAPIINSMFITPALEASDKVNAETTALLEEIDKNIPSKKMSVIAPDSGRHVDMNVREIVGYIMNSYMQNPEVPELYKNGKLDAGDYCKYMYGQLGLDKEQAKEIDGYIAYASAIGRGLLVLENETLIRNGQEPIAMRGNGMYFPSTRDNRSKIEKLLGVNFQITDPPLGVEGSTENTRATHEFNQTKLERKGDAADLDIFNAYRRVAHSIFSTIRMTDHVVRIRQFTEAIRGNIATAEDGSKLHETPMADGYYRNQPMVENSMGGSAAARAVGIAAQFDSFADNLAGKSTPGTRVLQKHFGRKIDQVMRALQSYSSMVLLGLNVRSAFSNAVPIARMMCIAPKEVLTAFRDTLKNLYGGETDDVQRNSDFLRARNALSTEETSFIPQKVKDILFAPMQIIDDIAAGTVMRAYYDVCRNKGYTHEEAIRQAETFSRRMLATKTKAARPQIYNNQFFAWLFQYGLESLNDFNFTMKDLPSIVAGVHGAIPSSEADTSTPDEGVEGLNAPKRTKISASGKIHYGATVIGLAIVAALYNLLNGTGSVDDPVGAAVQAVNETDADAPWYEKGLNAVKAAAIEAFPLSDRLGLESSYGSGIESLMPPSVQFVKSYINDIGNLISELGEDEFDSDSYMTLVDVLTGMLPAGTQLSRTAHGVNDLVRGYSTTNSGKVKFPVDQDNPINWFMLPVFGSNSAKNKEAIDYYLGANQSLTKSQSDTYKMFVENGIDPSVAYQSVMNWNDAKSASSYADKAEKMTDKEMGEVMAADAEGKNARSEVEVPSDMAPWAVKALESDANVQKGVELYREFGVKTYPVEFKPTSVDGKNYLSVDGKLYPMEEEDLSTVEADYKAQYAAAIRRYNDSGTTEAERRANAEKLEKEISQINTIIKKMIVNRKEGNHNGKK